MKTLLTAGALLFTLSIQQFPVAPPSPPPVQQRGAFPAAQTAQPAPLGAAECKCSIDVTVKRQSNGAPISDAEITISLIAPVNAPRGAAGAFPQPQAVLTGKTDESGQANFPNLAEGTYSITVRRDGFLGPSVNGSAPTSVFAAAFVGPAEENAGRLIETLTSSGLTNVGGTSPGNTIRQPVQHVTIIMVEGSIISGRILDANHRPAVGTPVVPFQISYQDGRRVLRQTANRVQTDDLGQYRVFWFAPGEYYLTADLTAVAGARGAGPNFPRPTYYPGTLELARARPIVVHEGEEISGTDFELQASGGATISGTVTNTLPGRVNPAGGISRAITSFFLVPRNSSVQVPGPSIPNAFGNGRGGGRDGDETVFPFELRGVPPGSYDFYPIFNDGATPRNHALTGRVVIDVGSENISGIQSVIQPGADLKIHVSVIGNPSTGTRFRPQQPVLPNIRMQIRPVDDLPPVLYNGLTPVADADGNISITNVPEAKFFISAVSGVPRGGYVSEIRQGPRSIMEDTVFNVGKETPEPLEITISGNGGTIAGTIEDNQHKPVVGTRVFLIPDAPRRRNLLLYKTVTSLANGSFYFQGIAPGVYRVFAWDIIPQGAEQNDEFMSRYEGSGTRVVVGAGTSEYDVHVTEIQGIR